MLDLKFIRDNPDLVRQALEKRQTAAPLDDILLTLAAKEKLPPEAIQDVTINFTSPADAQGYEADYALSTVSVTFLRPGNNLKQQVVLPSAQATVIWRMFEQEIEPHGESDVFDPGAPAY